MGLKEIFRHQFQEYVTIIEALEFEPGADLSEEQILMLHKNISRLTDFVAMLACVDESLLLLKCQKALGAFDGDLLALYQNYQQARLVGEEAELFDEHRQLEEMFSIEEAIEKGHYQREMHQLYLNTIEATGKLLSKHIYQWSTDNLKTRLQKYFETLISGCLDCFDRSDFDGLASLQSELLNNFQVLQRREDRQRENEGKAIEQRLKDGVGRLKRRTLLLEMVNKLLAYGTSEENLDEDLKSRIAELEIQLANARPDFEGLSGSLLVHIQGLFWNTR